MRDLTLVFRTGLAFLCAGAMLCGQGLLAQTQTQTQTPPKSQGLPPTTISLQNDALTGVRYDNHWQFYFGAGYRHFNAGPDLFQGSNMGGPDMQVTRRLSDHWGATGNVRMYWGTSGVVPNSFGIEGPLVSEYDFLAGPEWRGPHNKHAAVNLHALVGGSYGVYETELEGHPPGELGFYPNGLAFAGAFGGSLDLNRSPKLALRISPDLMLTHHGNEFQEQFAISVGLLYRFSNQRHHKQQPQPPPPAKK
jgi:hypothetical protein